MFDHIGVAKQIVLIILRALAGLAFLCLGMWHAYHLRIASTVGCLLLSYALFTTANEKLKTKGGR